MKIAAASVKRTTQKSASCGSVGVDLNFVRLLNEQ